MRSTRSRNARFRKPGWILAIALAAAVALAGASASAAPAPGPDSSRATIELRLAELHPADHPTAQADYEFARLVRERSGGRIRVSVYPDSVLGQEVSVLEQLQFGAIDIARVSLSAVSVYVPRLRALQMPYLYKDAEHMWRALKGPLGQELLASVSEAGFVGLGWFEAGARSFYTARRQIRSPADLKGLRIRVQEGGVMAEAVVAFGAIAVPKAFGEVYSAIQTGEIDGAENNASTYYTSKHYGIAPFFSLTEHARVPEIVVGSSVGFASLSGEDRALIAAAAMDTVDFQRAAWDRYEKLASDRIREAGASVLKIADLRPWRALVKGVYDRQGADIRAIVERVRALE
jgi:tripartite ATP-independent transporter DctP family solute receptor